MPKIYKKGDAESLVRRYTRMLEGAESGRLPAENATMYRRCLSYFGQMVKAWPEWYRDDPEYKKIYTEAKRKHKTVDHTVPLNNHLVCGLHVPWNLEPMSLEDNRAKSNKWWPDMPFQQYDLFTGKVEPHQMRLL